jgi:hypothetical protein
MHAMDEGLGTDRSTQPLFSSRSHRRQSLAGSPFVSLLILAVLIGAVTGGWYLLRARAGTRAPDVAAAAASAQPAPSTNVDDLSALPVPALGASDAFIRQMVARVSAHPQWATWLVTDDLVRRFVKTVVAVGRGSTPTANVQFAAPTEPFTVQSRGGREVIAPESYARYDLLTAAFVSFDAERAAQVYRKLHPLFEEAYAELGISDHTFDEMMALAVQNLTAVQIPAGQLEVVRDEDRYRFANGSLERLMPAAKHLLRFGPENAKQIQAKVGEIGRAVGISLL